MLRSSPAEEHICECGAEIEGVEFPELGRIIYGQKCRKCGAERERKHQEDIRHQEQLRREHALRETLSRVIPKLFENAHITDLPDKWQEEFFELIPDRGAYLYGSPGVGKTHSLCAIARELITRGYWVKRAVWERLTLNIRDCYGNKKTGATDKEIIQPLIDCDALIIEDIGTTTSIGNTESDFSLRVLLTILDSRGEQRKPIWFSSNKDIEQLSACFDGRIAGRVREHCEVILLDGKDRRKVR